MNSRLMAIWGLAVASLAGPGCVTFIGPEELRMAVSLSSGVGLDRKFGVGVDGLTLRMALAIAGIPVPVTGVLWVDVGVYEINRYSGAPVEGAMVRNIDLPGWESIVRTRGGGDEAAVFVRYDDRSIRGMVALVRDDEELAIVRLTGRIDRLLEAFLGGEGFAKLGWPGLASVTARSADDSAGDGDSAQ